MKKTILIFGWLIIFSTIAFAQNNDSTAEFEKQRRNQENLEVASEMSPASRIMHQRFIRDLDGKDGVKILQDAVLIGDRSVVPYLKARKELGLGPAQYIDLALVALGETQYVELAIEELKSKDPVIQYYAVWKLARFKTKESYRKLYELLDDNTNRDPNPDDDQPIETLSWVTKEMLSSTVENPPKNQQDTEAWKEWFKKNNLID